MIAYSFIELLERDVIDLLATDYFLFFSALRCFSWTIFIVIFDVIKEKMFECKYILIKFAKPVAILYPLSSKSLKVYCDTGNEYLEVAITNYQSSSLANLALKLLFIRVFIFSDFLCNWKSNLFLFLKRRGKI